MLKQIVIFGVICFSSSQISFASVASDDALHLAGVYQCYGHDSHDGAYKNAVATLAVDNKNSDFSINCGAYRFNLKEADGAQYVGEVAAHGNELAIYFKNTEASKSDDQGVGIAVVTHDKDTQGRITTSFHKFYYEPNYQGGGNGFEMCIKQ